MNDENLTLRVNWVICASTQSLDGINGGYHINAVDEVTQMECVFSVEPIAERFMMPILKLLVSTFPFVVRGFHADNGLAYINHQVAKLLRKLHIQMTQSHPRHANDNALTESKHGPVIRLHFGYDHIPGHWAPQLNEFHQKHFNLPQLSQALFLSCTED